METRVHETIVTGVEVDAETRCAHYRGENDIVAIRFKCCGKWFCCYQCHAELAGHAAALWPKTEFDSPAILCGSCGKQLTIREYLRGESVCPHCGEKFNPRCTDHYHPYFEG